MLGNKYINAFISLSFTSVLSRLSLLLLSLFIFSIAMSVHDRLLEITVTGCSKLKDTEIFSKQDPYVVLEYAGNKQRTRTDTDGGRNPTFNEKFMFPLIEGLREINVTVVNSNKFSADDFIGSGKILLQKALTEGYHDSTWPLSTRGGRRAGEVRVILHCTNPKGAHTVTSSSCTQHAPSAPSMYPPPSHTHYPPPGYGGYPPAHVPYPPPPYNGYTPPMPHGAESPYTYPPQVYPPQVYPPQVYPPYPPQVYPPYPPQVYPPYPSQGHGAPY